MGYLSNKKHNARVKTFLGLSVTISAIMFFLGFSQSAIGEFCNQYRWQIQLFLTIVFFYSLFHRRYGYGVVAITLCIINYFVISSAINITSFQSLGSTSESLLFASRISDPFDVFEQAESQNAQIVAVTNPKMSDFDIETMIPEHYDFLHSSHGWDSGFMLSSVPVEQSGRIKLDQSVYVDFVKVAFNNASATFIAVDFHDLDDQQIATSLNALSSFVSSQDNPVIIFGDFNTVAWSKNLSTFISRNGLVVKNALLDNIRNIIIPPHYYILGYKDNAVGGRIMVDGLNYFKMFTRF